MSSPDDALTGFYAVASQDAELKTALGVKTGTTGTPARFYEGWPADTLTESDYPRATYFLVSPITRRPGIYSVRVRVVGWFWPGPGAAAQRKAWSDRMLALFDEAHWSEGETRLYATVVPGRDVPAPPNAPLQRVMDLRIEVSPGPTI